MSSTLLGLARPEIYQAQLDEKHQLTQTQFADYLDSDIDVFASPASHFRMRAEFRIWHEGDTAHYAMYEPGVPRKPIVIERFSIGSTTICALMPKLIEVINRNPLLKERLYQIEFLTSLAGDALVTLIYHKTLHQDWKTEALALQAYLACPIIGRSKKQKEVLDRDFITESLKLNVGLTTYQQVETGFTQPNAFVCQHMLNWAHRHAQNLQGDLLELYCGNGNFTLPLSHAFDKVLATEVSKVSTRSALTNIQANQRSNIELVRLSAEEVSEALSGGREFRRLSHINLNHYHFSTIFLDPPRAGLDEATEHFASHFDNIIYISCNPETLLKNLTAFKRSHKVRQFALFDQFPYTHHRECGVILSKLPTFV